MQFSQEPSQAFWHIVSYDPVLGEIKIVQKKISEQKISEKKICTAPIWIYEKNLATWIDSGLDIPDKNAFVLTPEFLNYWLEKLEKLERVGGLADDSQGLVILFGMGAARTLPSRAVLDFAQVSKISLEVMPTEAACRTYNLLASDGRNVLALLVP